jgi:hypothetical protein
MVPNIFARADGEEKMEKINEDKEELLGNIIAIDVSVFHYDDNRQASWVPHYHHI